MRVFAHRPSSPLLCGTPAIVEAPHPKATGAECNLYAWFDNDAIRCFCPLQLQRRNISNRRSPAVINNQAIIAQIERAAADIQRCHCQHVSAAGCKRRFAERRGLHDYERSDRQRRRGVLARCQRIAHVRGDLSQREAV